MNQPSQQMTRWLQARPAEAHHQTRLFCFPYAGGGASMYREWPDLFDRSVHVCPVQLPGRENRMSEPPYSRVRPIVKILAEQLEPYFDLPFVFFGYSMGALLAYETARALHATDRPLPKHLVLAAHRAPQLPMRREAIYHLDDEGFRQGLRKLEGTPEEVLENEELMELMLPRLRADFTLYETYEHSPSEPLPIAMTILGGTRDHDIPESDLTPWETLSEKQTSVRLIEGNHFFIHTARDEVIGSVKQSIS